MASELEDAANRVANDGGAQVPDVHLFRDVRAREVDGHLVSREKN